jgi:hypothetical protein
MEAVKYVPSRCEGKDSKYSGHIMLVPPGICERYEYLDAIEEHDLDKEDEEDKKKLYRSNMKKIRLSIELSKKHYTSVHIKRKSDGFKYESFDDLSRDPECDGILIEIGGKITAGLPPSKNSKA